MSTKKIIYIIAGVLAAALLVGGIATASALADNGKPGGPGIRLLDRVAQILNIDKQKLADAFKQASTEIRTDRGNNMFSKLVADGKITQSQAGSVC